MQTGLDKLAYMANAGEISVTVPLTANKYMVDLKGTLSVSQKGYVYNKSENTITWIKFLALAITLPIYAIVSECKALAEFLFNGTSTHHQLASHRFDLAEIAWKATLGLGNKSLSERVEMFALNELKFNNPNTDQELSKKRSDRFKEGHYEACCMQPLFHKSQYLQSIDVSKIKSQLTNKKVALQKAIDLKDDNSIFWVFRWLVNPYSNLSVDELTAKKENVSRKLEVVPNKSGRPTEAQLKTAKRCEKYATYAIISQHENLSAAFQRNCVEEEDITCCGKTLYKSQTYCGLISKIECCAEKCWAINMLCCVVGIWPAGGRCCVL